MSQENEGANSATPENLPVKRKRGRPRKDKSLIQGEKASATPMPTPTPTPRPDTVKRSQRRKTAPAAVEDNSMVGHEVSGVLDGSFDAGYLLTVRIDNTNTILRGVVFEPGLSIPISGANDVAPHVKMSKRAEIPIPVVDPPTRVRGSSSQSERKSKQSVKVLQSGEASLLPEFPSPSGPSRLPITPVMLKGVQNDTNQVVKVPQVKDFQIEKSQSTAILPKDKVGLPLGVLEKTNSTQSEPKEPVSVTQSLPVEQNKTAKLAVLKETERPSQSVTPDDGDTSKDLVLERKTEPSVEISLSAETIDQVPPSEQRIDVSVKDQTVELNPTTVASTHQFMATQPITEPVKMLQGNQTFEKVSTQEATEYRFSVEIPRRDEISHSKGGQLSDAVEATLNAPYDSEAVFADKQSVLPNEPQISNSTVPTVNTDFVFKDATRSVQSQSNPLEPNSDTDSEVVPPMP